MAKDNEGKPVGMSKSDQNPKGRASVSPAWAGKEQNNQNPKGHAPDSYGGCVENSQNPGRKS